jgi:cytochrome P450
MIYHVHSIIQRDPAVYGDTADQFLPERWLHNASAIPSGAWRAFERGPRNCIGQELATIEARVAIAHVARRFSFTKFGPGSLAVDADGNPEMADNSQHKVESEL